MNKLIGSGDQSTRKRGHDIKSQDKTSLMPDVTTFGIQFGQKGIKQIQRYPYGENKVTIK
jgi:hypothetical protein